MFGLFKAAVDTALLPVSVARDVARKPFEWASCVDEEEESATEKQLRKIAEDLDED